MYRYWGDSTPPFLLGPMMYRPRGDSTLDINFSTGFSLLTPRLISIEWNSLHFFVQTESSSLVVLFITISSVTSIVLS